MITALSGPLNVNPLTLVSITLSTELGQSIKALLRSTQEELAHLAPAGVLKDLKIPSDELLVPRPSTKPSRNRSATTSQQVEFCFAE